MVKKRFFKTKEQCEVTFEVDPDEARSVALVCDHNGWEPLTMKRSRKGPFRTRVRFPKEGSFEFRYLVDDEAWLNDADADAYRPNGFGGRNGVIDTCASAGAPEAPTS